MIFPGDISMMPYLTRGKAEQLMPRTGQEKKAGEEWKAVRWDLPEKEVPV